MKKLVLSGGLILLLMLVPVLARADFIVLSASDFKANGETDPFHTPGSYLYMQTGGTSTSYFYTQIKLPDNAKINAMTVFYMDDSTENITVTLWKQNLYNASLGSFLTFASSGATPGIQNSKTTNVNWAYNTIVNSGAFYFVQLQFSNGGDGSSLRFYAVKIFYKTI